MRIAIVLFYFLNMFCFCKPPQVLGLLAVGVEQEAKVSSLLTNTEQCALHKSPRLKRGNLFAVGCDPCRRMKGSWWLSWLGLSLSLLNNTPLWPGFLLDGRLDGLGLVNRLVMPCPRLLLFLCSLSVLLVVVLSLSLTTPLYLFPLTSLYPFHFPRRRWLMGQSW